MSVNAIMPLYVKLNYAFICSSERTMLTDGLLIYLAYYAYIDGFHRGLGVAYRVYLITA